MEEAKKPFYRYCLVPICQNTIRSTPDKVFFSVPRGANIRKQWCKVMTRDKVSSTSHLHCCEDHFNIKEDTTNYMEYTIMRQQGEKVKLQLKEGVVPHIFHCQKRNMPPPKERMGAIKRNRLSLINEALSEFAVKSVNALESETSQISNYDAGHSTSNIVGCDDYQARPSTSRMDVSKTESSTFHIEASDKLHCDKPVQVNIKSKYRSKGVQVNLTLEKKFSFISFSSSITKYWNFANKIRCDNSIKKKIICS